MEKKVVLITGAARGIGRELALTFAKDKYHVGINYVQSDDKAKSLENEIKKIGGESLNLKADIGDSKQVQAMVQKIISQWGRLDVLVNNASLTRDRTILKMTDEEWMEPLRVNLNGSFWCLRESAKVMSKQKSGSIINISSIIGHRGSIGDSNYAASKAGLLGLTKGAAKELGRFNIKVNALFPGYHRTDLGNTVWEKYKDKIISEHTLGRLTEMQELTKLVLFLAEQNSISGQIFNFDSRVI